MKLSKGTKLTLLFFAAITVLGLILAYSDYNQHGDTSTWWWPVITAAIFLLVFFFGKRTDIVPALALLLLASAAASCAQREQPSAARWEQLTEMQPTWEPDTAAWARR